MKWYYNFFQVGPIPENAMYGEYNLYLVFLSYVIACLASYVALDMSAHLRKPTSLMFRLYWLSSGAFMMGAGIWSMHFVGMLAFIMPIAMSYNLFWTGLSMIAAIIPAALAFLFFTIKKPHVKHYIMSGIILGAAIPTMHYLGMAGMNNVKIHYNPFPFLLSILIAIVSATIALWLIVQSDKGTFVEKVWLKLGSALIMGFAIVGMHYAGMYATVFTPGERVDSTFSLDPVILSILIATIVISIIFVGLVVSAAKYFLDLSTQKDKDFLEAILDNIRGGVIACDPKGNINLTNHTIEDMFGILLGTNILKDWKKASSLLNPESNRALELKESPLYRALNGETIRDVEVIANDLNGNRNYLIADGKPLIGRDNEKLGAVIVYQNISKLKENEEKLKYSATHDILTGLPNRILLLDRIEQAISAAHRNDSKMVVIFIDLDNFKLINDALGHSIGDILLQQTAIRFQSVLRSVDTLARLGGDEFIIVIPDQKNILNVSDLLKRILKAISSPYQIEKNELRITCSLGLSVFPNDGKDSETLLKNADTAMYQAKESGRNTFQFYTGEMYTQVKKRLDLENDLRKALNNQEFFLEYQPKLDIKTNKLVGYEALIRWNHPQYGVIPPDDFIPLAEETGLILLLGKWVLKTACAQNKAWQEAGLPKFCVSVNLSSRQCKDKNLIEMIKEILNETKLSPEFLELELTENVAISDPERFIILLSEFKALGIKTSIDDFGTGYSSLNYLRKFPVSTLKIDRAFIQELEQKTNNLSILKAIISLGHSLNLTIIVEGVETKEQFLRLKENGCDEIQGYYLSYPIPAQDIPSFIKNLKTNT